jgi:ubiquinone/menaquinone biosynthesis C-methylase UbiE
VSGQPFRLDSPLLVQWEYASEERLRTRNEAYRRLVHGVNAEELAFECVAEASPERVLEVGCGTGEFAERVAAELGAEVAAIDISARMVELSRARGIDARVADLKELPFEDASFDVAVANWVLYHVPDIPRGLREIDRVLRPGGRLVAATLGVDHMVEAWRLVGGEPTHNLTFWSENGAEVLGEVFPRVERREAEGTLVFPDPQTLREFIASTITRAHLAENVPDFEGPLATRSAHVVFVAEKA